MHPAARLFQPRVKKRLIYYNDPLTPVMIFPYLARDIGIEGLRATVFRLTILIPGFCFVLNMFVLCLFIMPNK